MDMSTWDLWAVVVKLLVYVGLAAVIGGPFIACMTTSAQLLLTRIRRYCLLGSGVALLGSVLQFLLSVGALAEMGLAGMWDPLMLEIMWISGAGDSFALRALGFSLTLIVCLLARTSIFSTSGSPLVKWFLMAVYLLAVLLLLRSFSVVGHTSELPTSSQIMLQLHVLIAAWWMGALWPLWVACHELDKMTLHRLMHRFGRHARVVTLLILCGAILVYGFIDSVQLLVQSGYGQVLMLKLLMVVGILLLACWHKFSLVPALNTRDGAHGVLARSIYSEIWLGFVILAATAGLTSLVGPAH